MTRLAVCGVGKIGKVHLENLRTIRGCQVTGVYDSDSAELEHVARRYGVRAYGSGDEMLADDGVDAVVVATPSSSHRGWCQRVLCAKKHLFVEKPLAGTLEDAKSIAAAAHASDCVVQVGFCERFNAQHLEARRAVRSGALGKVRAMHTSRVAPYALSDASWDLGVLDTAVHNLDLILWLMGRSPVTVLARGVHVYPESGIPHSATIMLGFDDGAMAVDHIAWLKDDAHPLHSCARSRMLIQGDEGVFTVDLTERPSSLLRSDSFRQIDSVIIGGPEYSGCLKLQFEAFLESIETGAPVLAAVEDALATERVAIAAQRSLRTGREVQMGDVHA